MKKIKDSIDNQSYSSVWDVVADTPEQAENLRIRAALVDQIIDFIEQKQYTQAQAAKICHVTQPRMSDLMHGRISKFSLDALVNIAAAAGFHVNVILEEEFA